MRLHYGLFWASLFFIDGGTFYGGLFFTLPLEGNDFAAQDQHRLYTCHEWREGQHGVSYDACQVHIFSPPSLPELEVEGDFQELPCWEVAHFVWMIAWRWRIHRREIFLIIFSTPCLDWREVTSWFTVDGPAYTVIDAEQQRSWSLVIARGSEQFESRDLCDYWPQWRWDPGGLLIGWYHERPVWDPGIEISLHIRVMQETERFQWDPGTFCSIGREHQLESRLVQALLENKQFLPDEDATWESEQTLQHPSLQLLEDKQRFAGGDCNIPN